jgi:hypothetical protein
MLRTGLYAQAGLEDTDTQEEESESNQEEEEKETEDEQKEEQKTETRRLQTETSATRKTNKRRTLIPPLLGPPVHTELMDIVSIANHKPLSRTCPISCRSRFVRQCAKFFNPYMRASAVGDGRGMTESLSQIMAIPSYMFVKMTRGRRGLRRKRKQIMDQALTGTITPKEAKVRTEVMWKQTDEERKKRYGVYDDDDPGSKYDLDRKKVRNAVATVSSKHIGRATKTLMQQGRPVSAADEHVFKQLQLMHPQDKGVRPDTAPPRSGYKAVINLSDPQESKHFSRFIHSLNRGSAPGISGWTGDMMVLLLTNKICRWGLAQLLTDIVNGRLPEEAKQYILPSHLIALPKDDNRIRPISIGEIFYRAAAAFAIEASADVLAEVMTDVQFGVGVPAGCEQAVHQLRHMLTRKNKSPVIHDQFHAGIAVDFTNAFNERNRDDILKALYNEEQLQPLWKLAHWSYSTPSDLWTRNAEENMISVLQSTSGVKQGDPLGSILFALSMKPIYKGALEITGDKSIQGKAFQDDMTLVGPCDIRLVKALKKLKEGAEQGGLQINMKKTKLIWLHPTPFEATATASMQRELRAMGIEVITGCTKLLGACIGTEREKLRRMTNEIVDEHELFFQRLCHPALPSQIAMLLLRACGVPRFNYLARTGEPSATIPASKIFDSRIDDVLRVKFHLPMSRTESAVDTITNTAESRALQQLMLPIKMAGCGVKHASNICSQAYLASLIACQHLDQQWWKKNKPSKDNNQNWIHEVEMAIKRTREEIQGKENSNTDEKEIEDEDHINMDIVSVPVEGDEFDLQQFISRASTLPKATRVDITRLQHKWGHLYHKQKTKQWEQSIENQNHDEETGLLARQRDRKRVQILRCRENLSHLWMQVIPTERILMLRDSDYELALRLRLGLIPFPSLASVNCVCGVSFADDPFHSLVCTTSSWKEVVHRHNLVLYRLKEIVTRACIPNRLEVSNLHYKRGWRPDLEMTMSDNRLHIVDVTITHPLTRRWCNKLHNTVQNIDTRNEKEGAFMAAEGAKRRKYRSLIHEHGALFSTAALHSTGGMGPELIKLLEHIQTSSCTFDSPWEAQELAYLSKAVIAIALQVGNARVMTANKMAVLRKIATPNYHIMELEGDEEEEEDEEEKKKEDVEEDLELEEKVQEEVEGRKESDEEKRMGEEQLEEELKECEDEVKEFEINIDTADREFESVHMPVVSDCDNSTNISTTVDDEMMERKYDDDNDVPMITRRNTIADADLLQQTPTATLTSNIGNLDS